MAHELQNRYSNLVDAKLRATLVKKDGVVFSTRFEGSPAAGVVQIPVRETEVAVGDYNKQDGATKTQGATAYVPLNIDKDKAVNEIIDGFDAAAVPDDLAADRLDSAAYALGLQIEQDATAVLEAKATAHGGTEALTADSIYNVIVGMRTALSKVRVPNDGKRFLLASPDAYGLLLNDEHFVHATELGDEIIATGAVGKAAGFLVFEDTTLGAKTELIAGHPNWCVRATEWKVPVHIQDLNGSGEYIGASAVQGRMVYGHAVTKAKTLLIKKQA